MLAEPNSVLAETQRPEETERESQQPEPNSVLAETQRPEETQQRETQRPQEPPPTTLLARIADRELAAPLQDKARSQKTLQ